MKISHQYLFKFLIIFFAFLSTGHAVTCTTVNNLDGATTPNSYAANHNFDNDGSSVGNVFALGFPGDVRVTANGYKGDSSTFPIRVKVGTTCGGSDLANTLVENTHTYDHTFHFPANQNYYITIEAATIVIDGSSVTTQATDFAFQYVPDDAEAVLSMLIDDGEGADGILIDTPYTYNVDPKNSGNTDASDVTFSATVETGITITAASGPGWSCGNTATTVTCTMSNMPHDDTSKPLSITAIGSTPNVTKRLNATLTSTTNGPDGTPANFDAIEDTTFYEHTMILVGSKIDGLDATGNEVLTDTQFTYTLSMSNTGNFEATEVVLEDELNSHLIFVGASAGCSRSGQTVSCDLGTINSGSSKSVSITVRTVASLGGPLALGILNTMTATSTSVGADLSGATATEATNIIERYTDLAVDVHVTGSNTRLTNEDYEYNIDVENHGTIDAEGVKIVSQLTNGLIYRGPSPSGWNCSASGATLTCTKNTNLLSGTSENITIPVTAPSTAGTVEVQSVITTTTDSSTDSDTKSTTIQATAAILNVIKAVNDETLIVGQEFYYGIEVGNTGNEATIGTLTVVDDLPAQITYLNAYGVNWTCNYSSPRVTCTHAALAAGETADNIIIEARATTAGTNIRNTATANDANGVTGSDWEDINIYATTVEFTFGKSTTNDTPLVGEDFEYHILTRNTGNSVATDLVVTDTLPAEVIYRDPPGASGTGWTCNYDTATRKITCEYPSLAANTTAPMITIPVTASSTLGVVQNCAHIEDTDGNNRDDCVDIEITDASVNLFFNEQSRQHTGVDNWIHVGDPNYWYYMEIRNTGTIAGTDVNLTMELPPEVTYYRHVIWNHSLSGNGNRKLNANKIDNSYCSMVGHKFSCTFPTVPVSTRPANKYDGIQVLLYVKKLPLVPGTLTSTAYINESTTVDDTHTFNAQIKIYKADLEMRVDDPPKGTIFTDQDYSYFMEVKNLGNQSARGLKLTHTLPDGYTFRGYSTTGNSTWNNGTRTDHWDCDYDLPTRQFTCEFDKNSRLLLKNKYFRVTLDVTSSSTPGDNEFKFEVEVDPIFTTDNDLTNNVASYFTEVVARTGAISVEKTSPTPVYINESFLYTVKVDNIGDVGSELRDVNLTDNLPAGVTYNSATGPGWTCIENSGTLTCNNPTIYEGDAVSIIEVNVTAPSSDMNISNTAIIDAIVNDLNDTESNNSSVNTEILTRYPELVAYKISSQNPVTVERPFAYYLGVQNFGNTVADNVTFTDILPKDMNYTGYSGSDSHWHCTDPASFIDQTVTCSYDISMPITTDPSVYYYVRLDVLAPTTDGNITNRVDVNTSSLEAITTNNFAEVDTVILPEYADLRISQTDTPDPVTAGAFYEYNILVENIGEADANDVVVIDTLDASVIYTAYATGDDWSCSHNGAVTVTCTKASPIAVGDSSSFTLHVRAPSSAATVDNSISVTTSTAEVVTNNNNSLEITDIVASALVGFFPFDLRAHYILSGDIKTIGNTVLCEKIAGVCNTNTVVDNASVSLDYVVVDSNVSGDLATPPFNATSASFELPIASDPSDTAEVIWAGLYWQGMTTNGSSEDNDTNRQQVYLKNDSNGYKLIQADDYHVTNVYKLGKTNYAAMADVTSTVQAYGPGKYTVANLTTSDGIIYGVGAYGAWSLVIVYYDPDSDEIRSLSVFDGWQVITHDPNEGNSELNIPLSGFRTPATGNVDAKLSIFTAEGDAQISGDTLQAKSGTTSFVSLESVNGVNPGTNNVMNASISGVPVRDPNLNNNNGIDIQNYDIGTTAGAAGILQNNDTVLQVKMATSSLDTYFPSMMTVSVELLKPDICYDYSIKQNGIFLDVDFPQDNRRPDLNISLATTDSLTFNVYFKNREGDISATNLSMYTDFSLLPDDLQIKYIEDSVRKTDVNGSGYYDYPDSHIEVDASTSPDVRIAMGENPTDALNGGTLSVGESQYLQFNVQPQTAKLEMSLKINLGMILLFDDGYTMNLPRYRLGKDIKPCAPSPSYNPVWGQFTVIDRLLNSDNNTSNFKYNLRTQVSDRPYDIDLVSLKENTNPENSPSHWEPLEANTTVHVELADLSEFSELNASCGDSFNTIPGTREFVTFSDTQWRKTLTIKSTPYAKRNLTYRIWFIEDNTTLIHHNCGDPSTSGNCYQTLYTNKFASKGDTYCASRGCSSNDYACYECLRGRYGRALCSRDNFSIRPEAFDIDNLKDSNTTNGLIEVPALGVRNEHHVAARYPYTLEINATSYNYRDDGLSQNTMRGVPGYNQNLTPTGDSKIQFFWYEDHDENPSIPAVTCNDTNDLNMSYGFKNYYNQITGNVYSYGEANKSTPNIGKYRIKVRDIDWTGVDRYDLAQHHSNADTRNFFTQLSTNRDDCTPDSNTVPNIRSVDINGSYRVGCIISSSHTKLVDINATPITLFHEFNDTNITSHPERIIFIPNTNSHWKAKQYLNDSNDTFIYMNGVKDDNISHLNMAAHLETILKAVDKNGTILSNFTDSCYSQDLDMNFSVRAWDNGDTNVSITSRIVALDENNNTITLSSSDANRTLESNITIQGEDIPINVHIPKLVFDDDLNGTAKLQLHINIDRNITQPKNPYRIQFEDVNLTCTRQGSNPLIPLNDCNITSNSKTEPTSTLFDFGDKNVTFIYGRVHAPRYRIEVPNPKPVNFEKNITIYYEAYCNLIGGCRLLDDIVSPNKKRSVNSINWYQNEAHTADDSNVNIYQVRGAIVLSGIQKHVDANLTSYNNAVLRYTGTSYPYRATMKIDTSNSYWLTYNKFEDNNATANRFEVEFRQKGIRPNKEQGISDDNGAVNSNRRIMW